MTGSKLTIFVGTSLPAIATFVADIPPLPLAETVSIRRPVQAGAQGR